MQASNLLANIPSELPEELATVLASGGGVRVERIVSRGHASPPGFWYDQPVREWVLLVTGAARLRFEDRVLELRPGDCVDIPPHAKHRVDWTAPDGPTVWLAVYFPGR